MGGEGGAGCDFLFYRSPTSTTASAATLSLCSCWHVVHPPPTPPPSVPVATAVLSAAPHLCWYTTASPPPTACAHSRCCTFSNGLSGLSCVGSVDSDIVPSQKLLDARDCGTERWCKTNLLQKNLLIVLSSVPTVDLQPALLAFCPSCHYSRPQCAAQLAISSKLNVATVMLNCERFLDFLFCLLAFSLQ